MEQEWFPLDVELHISMLMHSLAENVFFPQLLLKGIQTRLQHVREHECIVNQAVLLDTIFDFLYTTSSVLA